MTKINLISKILFLLNEAGVIQKDQTEFYGADEVSLSKYIEGSYTDAWRRCIAIMPSQLFENRLIPSQVGREFFPNPTEGTGYVVLPSDFYKLAKFKMRGWHVPVLQATYESQRVVNIQSNEYLRGDHIRPVCYIEKVVLDTTGKQVEILRYYSLPKERERHQIESAYYVPICKELKDMDDNDPIAIHSSLIEPICYLVASTVSVLLGKYEEAKALDIKAVEILPALKSSRLGSTTFKN